MLDQIAEKVEKGDLTKRLGTTLGTKRQVAFGVLPLRVRFLVS